MSSPAADRYRVAIDIERDPMAMAELAYLLATSIPPVLEPTAALTLASEAAVTDHMDGRIFAALAEACFANDDFVGAIAAISRAIELSDTPHPPYDDRLAHFQLLNR